VIGEGRREDRIETSLYYFPGDEGSIEERQRERWGKDAFDALNNAAGLVLWMISWPQTVPG